MTIKHATVSPGTIEFTMPLGGGETAAKLHECLALHIAVPRELIDYINGAVGLMIPTELAARSWRVDRMDYHRGSPVRVRVVLKTSNT